jgi:hypothetical protein
VRKRRGSPAAAGRPCLVSLDHLFRTASFTGGYFCSRPTLSGCVETIENPASEDRSAEMNGGVGKSSKLPLSLGSR